MSCSVLVLHNGAHSAPKYAFWVYFPSRSEKRHKLANLLLHLRGNSEGGSMSLAILFPVGAAILVTVLILIVLYRLVSHLT